MTDHLKQREASSRFSARVPLGASRALEPAEMHAAPSDRL